MIKEEVVFMRKCSIRFIFIAIMFISLILVGTGHAELSLTNFSFESKWYGYPYGTGYGYQYLPTGSDMGWTFSGGAGVSDSNTAWGGAAYDGSRFAFLQGAGSSISQSFNLTSSSKVAMDFFMALRPKYPAGQQVKILLDGVERSLIAAIPSWTEQTINFGVLSGGSHTLAFIGTGSEGLDTSVYLDKIQLAVTPVPLPSALYLLTPGLLGLIGFKRKYLG
jgi:hypothetical protein